MKRVLVIGAGQVGAHIIQQGIAQHLPCHFYLLDLNDSLTKAQTLDLKDSLMFSNYTTLQQVSRENCPFATMDIVVITAGANQEPGETRLDLLEKNAAMVQTLAKELKDLPSHAIILMVTNPVDILTQVARRVFPLPKEQIFGTGTMLDSARLRWRIAEKLERNIRNVHGYVLGEHGDSEFVAWSSVSKPHLFSAKMKQEIEEEVAKAAYEIIEGKGATCFGIGASTVHILDAVLHDSHAVIPVSCHYPHFEDKELKTIPLGVPCIISAKGIEVIPELDLTKEELEKLENSAKKLISAAGKYAF